MKSNLSVYDNAIRNIDNLDDFLKNKMNFLEESDYTEIVNKNYWRIFYSKFWKHEKRNNKDLAMFNENEIIELVKSIYTSSDSFIRIIKSLLNRYEDWALETGLNPTYNPVDNINFEKIKNVDTNVIKESYIDIDELVNKWYEVSEEEKDYQSIAALLLARLGLKGKGWSEIKYLTINDIDFENSIINVTNRNSKNLNSVEIIKTINVENDDILEILKKANEETFYVREIKAEGVTNVEYKDTPYLLKVLHYTDEDVVTSTAFRNKLVRAFEIIDINYIPAKNLFRSAELDRVIEIRDSKKSRKVMTSDFSEVAKEFESYADNASATRLLKEFYRNVTGDTDILDSRVNYDEFGNKTGRSPRNRRKSTNIEG